jgi:hypothetical protein
MRDCWRSSLKVLVAFILGLGLQRLASGSRAGSAVAPSDMKPLVRRVEEVVERLERQVVSRRRVSTARWAAGMLLGFGALFVAVGYEAARTGIETLSLGMETSLHQDGFRMVRIGYRVAFAGVFLGLWTIRPWAK